MKVLVIYVSEEQEKELNKMVRINHILGSFLPGVDAIDRLAATVLAAIGTGKKRKASVEIDGAATMPSQEELLRGIETDG